MVALFCFASIPIQAAATITNLAQLNERLGRERQFVEKLQIAGSVFAADTNTGALVLQDSSGLSFLELDDLAERFQPGDQIEISGQPAWVALGELGVRVTTAPLLDNDGIHGIQSVLGRRFLPAGRHPVRLDWFNQMLEAALTLVEVPANPAEQTTAPPGPVSGRFQDLRAAYYHGSWVRLPNFQMLHPVKTAAVNSFEVESRTRKEKVGIRFEGYFEAPQDGTYTFSLTSDDGSRLWIGPMGVTVRKVGAGPPPTGRMRSIGERMSRLDASSLATIEGRVLFVSRVGKGLRMELRADERTAAVVLANAGSLDEVDLLNAQVRVAGVAGGILRSDRRVVLGTLTTVGAEELTVLEPPPGRGQPPETLRSAMQVHSLSSEVAARRIPVELGGVVTAVGQAFDQWMVIQDDTRGVFVRLDAVAGAPEVGERWEVAGYTQPGDFAPVIVAEKATRLGRGRLPEPAQPSSSQLANGSMDVQWVELQGVVTAVQEDRLSLLLADGRLEIRFPAGDTTDLQRFENALVRIRGASFSMWDAETHEVQVGTVILHNASVSVERAAPLDPFDAPEKTPRGLFRFDAKATPLQRVKVRGQVTYAYGRRVFLENDAGIEVLAKTEVELQAGDFAEAVGYPSVSGVGPQLHVGLLRKIGAGDLGAAPQLREVDFPEGKLTFTRLRIQGQLVGLHWEVDQLVLQIQADRHLYLAYVPNAHPLLPLRLGSRLALTGIYVSGAPAGIASGDTPHFELLVNAPGDVAVLSRPSWWTLPRLLSAVGILLVILTLSAIWIVLLRRQVTQRTLQLREEIRERERAERQHVLEAERARIARDLHDDLGSRLTEINFLASTSDWGSADEERSNNLEAIGDRARDLVKALDVIVWAVDPADDSLQSLADYLSGYAREYLANSAVQCRFQIPMSFPNATLDGRVRHEVLMVAKETLNNIVRHAQATEVRFQMSVSDQLEIRITDNGKGFAAGVDPEGHGLKNCATRLAQVGGRCEIESGAGVGTTVWMRIPLAEPVLVQTNEKPN